MRFFIILILLFFAPLSILKAQHLRKDGQPDMRFRENKQNFISSTTASYRSNNYTQVIHLKKDGSPDKRFKGNRTTISRQHIPVRTSSYHTVKNYSYKSPSGSKTYSTSSGQHRDSKGRFVRSSSAKLAFMKKSGYPHGRPGYVVDHIVPLKKGGCDCPSNMQWQTISAAKAKDKWE
jgi:hypothetical protein